MRTREHVLSSRTNPWFFSTASSRSSSHVRDAAARKAAAGGTRAFVEGVGSPHTGPRTIWPMAIIMRALTSDRDAEIAQALGMLKAAAAADDAWLMHESFALGDASTFTRPWFAWANSLFGELVLKLAAERPHLLF